MRWKSNQDIATTFPQNLEIQLLFYFHFTVLNVFQIVKFANGPCNATSTIKGVCYTVNECTERGGLQMGTCASGFGACCTCKNILVLYLPIYFESMQLHKQCVTIVYQCTIDIAQLMATITQPKKKVQANLPIYN